MEKILLLVLLASAAVLSPPGVEATCTVDSLGAGLEALVVQAVSTMQGSSVAVTVSEYNIVCLTTGATRGSYSSASVIVNCTVPGGTTGTACPASGGLQQFEFQCDLGVNFPAWFSPSTNFADPVGADLMTSRRTDCGLCMRVVGSQFTERLDSVTHCVACSSLCNTGLMECTGLGDADCCNGVVNNTCVANCTAPERPLSSANYTCTEFCDRLDLANGSITYSNGLLVGSVATHICDVDFELQGDANLTCEVIVSSTSWSGNAPSCVSIAASTMAMMTDNVTTMATTMAASMAADTTQTPPTCEALVKGTNQIISYSGGCSVEVDCQAVHSCDKNYELVGGATIRTCSLPSDMKPVWSGVAPKCEVKSNSLTGAEFAGIGIAVAVVVAAVLIAVVVIVIIVLSRN